VKQFSIRTNSPGQTQALGEKLAYLVRPGDIIALRGELGSGKTEFVRGLAQGLGVSPDQVSSPTFVLVHEYAGRLSLIHIDLYRLDRVEGDFLLELEEYLSGPYVTVIEWSERLNGALPREYLGISLSWGGEQSRDLIFQGYGRRGQELWAALIDLYENREP
jgi:tRNA threonylcarbamoyladenosine biosynthesis protein TsaE